MIVKITLNEKNNPPGKLADAEADQLQAIERARRTGGGRNVTFPSRTYSVNGERRSFALLRPATAESQNAQDGIREAILVAYAEAEEKAIADEANSK